jgi:CDP-diacylglycerol--glycerol-3-phosphate 3-phosphatidyltransferase
LINLCLSAFIYGFRYDAVVGRKPIHIDLAHGIGPVTWPMGLTFLRIFLLPVFLYLILADVPLDVVSHPARHAALIIFAVMAATDKLDGYLARKLNQASKMGALLDPVADKLLVAASIVLLSFPAVSGLGFAIAKFVVISVYAKDLLLAFGTLVILSRKGKVAIRARLSGKVSTVIQLSLVMATLVAPDVERVNPGVIRIALPFFGWATAASAAVAAIDYVIQGWKQLTAAPAKEVAATDAHR